MATNTPAVFFRGNPAYGSTNVQRTVTTAALTSNLVTLTFGSNHGLTQVGTLISVQGVGASYDGLFPVNSFPGLNTCNLCSYNRQILVQPQLLQTVQQFLIQALLLVAHYQITPL
jgi:hypothetical protein